MSRLSPEPLDQLGPHTTDPTNLLEVPAEMCPAHCEHPNEVAQARQTLVDAATYQALAALFRALADPTRAKIVHLLSQHTVCTCDLAAIVGISKPGVSQHLRLLRRLRLVTSRREGKFVYYRLDDAHVALLTQMGLAHIQHPIQQPDATSHSATLVVLPSATDYAPSTLAPSDEASSAG